jgi:peptidoglycan/xylan/chitin deacetylase (PgdA/CDA1 family)
MALTFDDGPYVYTSHILDVLKQYNVKATFFVTGNNLGKGQIDLTYHSLIKRMVAKGHQIASHTWTHQNLAKLSFEQIMDQMIKNEMVLRNILGYFPTYMRPPYSACEKACQDVMSTLGYVIAYFSLDTDDYSNTSLGRIQNAKNNFDNYIKGSNPANDRYLVIAHDIHEQTAHSLTIHMLQRMHALGYKGVTVGECLNDPPANWYRSASRVTPSTPTNAGSTDGFTSIGVDRPSSDGTCGPGKTCQGSSFRECCSRYGYCGKTPSYCGPGCQKSFGVCKD